MDDDTAGPHNVYLVWLFGKSTTNFHYLFSTKMMDVRVSGIDHPLQDKVYLVNSGQSCPGCWMAFDSLSV